MLACASLAAIDTSPDTAFSVTVGAGETAVNADLSKSFSVFFSEIFA
jgi:hypothetical protein